MSFYYYVYMCYPERFTKAGFEEYCRRFGLQVTIPETFTLSFQDMLFSMTIHNLEGGEERFNIPLDPGAAVRRPRHKKVTLWDKLFKRYPARFQDAIRHTTTVWRLCGSAYGPWDALVMFLLGGYLVEACDGVLDTPDVDKFFPDRAAIDPEIHQIMEHLGVTVK